MPQSKVVELDARKVREVVSDNSVDLVLFGPPYWREYTYSSDREQIGKIKSYESYLSTMKSHFAELVKVLKPGKAFCFWAHDLVESSKGEVDRYIPLHGDLIKCLPSSVRLLSVIPWDRYLVRPTHLPAKPLVQGTKLQYIVIASKGSPSGLALRRFAKSAYWSPVWRAKTTPTVLGSKRLFRILFRLRSIFRIPVPRKILRVQDKYRFRDYDTQCPPEVASVLIKILTRKGETVLDPYCGSGTSLKEAISQDRKAIGLDVSRRAVRVTKKRLDVDR